MKLERKVGNIGDSVCVVIPSEIAARYGITKGTVLNFDIKEPNKIILEVTK